MKMEQPLFGETPFEQRHEPAVELNDVELISRTQPEKDFPSHRAGAGTDFQDSAWGSRCSLSDSLAKLRDQSAAQKSAAGQQSPRIVEMTTCFPKEIAALDPIAHPRCLDC